MIMKTDKMRKDVLGNKGLCEMKREGRIRRIESQTGCKIGNGRFERERGGCKRAGGEWDVKGGEVELFT